MENKCIIRKSRAKLAQDSCVPEKSAFRLSIAHLHGLHPELHLRLPKKESNHCRELKCCYSASIDGFSALNFHGRCDFKGPCVVVAYTAAGFKFGAFNPEGYRSTDDYYDTFDAFLFYWKESGSGGEEPPVVLPKVGGSGAAIFDYARGGPQFGADGLLIGPPLSPVMGVFTGPDASAGVGDLRQAKSRLGLSYAKREDGKESIFGDVGKATLAEVQVFCSPQIASLY
ncbi:hypothetical protein Cni_G10278 [Canna indica]|uniref:TLDc domain-containing protein n=1 Tax=Canna indica TaxID=4628 RepID=A0AAQ3Q9R2_9LILI|nr:hypothetical protein Cni_G10278 [Canna indica]